MGESPSTLRLIMPEVYLGDTPESQEQRTVDIQKCMNTYGDSALDKPRRALLLVERTALGRTRHGIMLAVDLEEYDFKVGSSSKVRATEKTIEARLPPRVAIRQDAIYELPHILVLVDDPDKTIVEPLVQQAKDGGLAPVYNFDLMKNGGSLKSWEVADKHLTKVIAALEKNYSKQEFTKRYGSDAESKPPMLFGVGDGNHSLASAKAFWNQLKEKGAGMDHPARHALIEINNVHDEGLIFEPIHRLVFDVPDVDACFTHMETFLNDAGEGASFAEKVPEGFSGHVIECFHESKKFFLVEKPSRVLAVATLQAALDSYMKTLGEDTKCEIDFIHGTEAIEANTGKTHPQNVGFTVPAMDKNHLFKTVVFDGVLPRKTFSMGEADEKRFYCELRKITQ